MMPGSNLISGRVEVGVMSKTASDCAIVMNKALSATYRPGQMRRP